MSKVKGHMRKRLALLAVVALGAIGVGVAAPAASAHGGSSYYWSAVLAKSRVKGKDIVWADGSYDDIVATQCSGRGGYIWNDYGTLRLYQHFVCGVMTSTGATYSIKLHVVDHFNFDVDFLGYI